MFSQFYGRSQGRSGKVMPGKNLKKVKEEVLWICIAERSIIDALAEKPHLIDQPIVNRATNP